MLSPTAISSKSFTLSGIGIQAFLKHSVDGLPAGTVLISITRAISWQVKGRLIWLHSAGLQKRFSNETEVMGHINFGFSGNARESARRRVELEEEIGYQYILLPINHNEEPLEKEELLIEVQAKAV